MTNLEENEKSINDETVSVKIINPTSFIINLDARKFSPYERNGIAKQIKVPRKLEFKTLEELEAESDISTFLDANMLISDFEKLETKQITHYLYIAVQAVEEYRS